MEEEAKVAVPQSLSHQVRSRSEGGDGYDPVSWDHHGGERGEVFYRRPNLRRSARNVRAFGRLGLDVLARAEVEGPDLCPFTRG